MKVGDVSFVARMFGLHNLLIEVSKQHGVGTLGVEKMLKVPTFHLHNYADHGNVGEIRWTKIQYGTLVEYVVKDIAWHPMIFTPNDCISDDERRDQVIHELGHLVAILGRGHTDHGDEWKEPTRALGGTAYKYHRLDGRLK